MKKNDLLKGVKSAAFAVGLTFAAILTTAAVAKPVQVHAASESYVRERLNDDERKIYDAYDYLQGRIKDQNLTITAENITEYNSDTLYTMYSGNNEKKKYSANDLKFARRAYVYTHPTEISAFMAEMKFVYVKTTAGKYNCYAYLRRTGDNNYANEEKQLTKVIRKIVKNIDEDTSDFTTEMQCLGMVVDNVVFDNVAIDNRDIKNTAYGALVKHRGSYQGYALAFAALLDETDVENDILFSDDACWNQIKISSKWYETNIPKMERIKKGIVDYGKTFNISRSSMASHGFKRVDYATRMRESKGRASQTSRNLSDYTDQLFKNADNLALAILEDDGTIARTNMTTAETEKKFVLTYISGSKMTDIGVIVSSLTVNAGAGLTVTHEFSAAEPYITLKKNPASTDRSLTATVAFWGINGTITLKANVVDVDNNNGKNLYKVISEEAATVSYKGNSNKNIKNIVIPECVTLNGKVYKVVKIEKNAFKKSKKLETVIIGSNVKEIGSNAFTGKTKLIRVETRGAVIKKIGKNAFGSADENTFFLLYATKSNQYKQLVKKIKKAGGKNSVYKYRNM